jgi:hypothetical protein
MYLLDKFLNNELISPYIHNLFNIINQIIFKTKLNNIELCCVVLLIILFKFEKYQNKKITLKALMNES